MGDTIQIITFLGGLALFLLGIESLSSGLQRIAGSRFKQLMASFTQNSFKGVITGTVMTSATQSSSATTVMLVTLVEAGLLSFGKSLSVILGAGIGTTVTVQLIAFHLDNYALLIIFAGLMLSYSKEKSIAQKLSKPLIGFGLIFYGMHLMSSAMAPIQDAPWFLELIKQISNPVLGILIGVIFTALMQSSGAFIGILLILTTSGSINLVESIPLMLGANLGTTITAFIASLKTSREGFKVALAHALIKLTGILIFVWWMPFFGKLVTEVSQLAVKEAEALSSARLIANAHTFYNILLTILFFPLLRPLAYGLDKLLPSKKAKAIDTVELTSIQGIENPKMALTIARHETEKFALHIQRYTKKMLTFFTDNKGEKPAYMAEAFDNIEKQYNSYHQQLLTLSKNNQAEEEINEIFQVLFTLKEFFQIARLMHLNLPVLVEEWNKGDFAFSKEGQQELNEYHLKLQKQISRAIEVFQEVDIDKAKHMKYKYKKYRNLASELEEQHFERIRDAVQVSIDSSSFHLHLLTLIRDMTSHATNIARLLIRWHHQET